MTTTTYSSLHLYMKKYNTLLINTLGKRVAGSVLTAILTTGMVHAQTNNALNFDGADDYVNLPSSLTTGVTNFTFEAWLNYQDNGNWTRVMDFGANTTVNMFLTPSNSDTGAPRFAITASGSPGEERLTAATALSAGRHHLAVTLQQNGATVEGTLYIDGVVAATNSGMTLTPQRLGTLTQLYLGRSEYAVDPYLKGDLDEVRLYSTALTQAQIQADLAATTGASAVPASLLAYYDFNQGIAQGNNPTATTLLERSNNARHGTLFDFSLAGNISNWVGPAVPLPVSLTAFEASLVGGQVRLNWQTASERANAYFAIERSLDGRAFSALGTVAGQGSTNTATRYVFTDAGTDQQAAAGAVYYRLRQVDLDGSSTYSPVRIVGSVVAAPAVSLYPNPAALATTLDLRALPSTTYLVQLLDATGRVAQEQEFVGGQSHSLSLTDLPSGIYLVLISGSTPNSQRVHYTQRLERM